MYKNHNEGLYLFGSSEGIQAQQINTSMIWRDEREMVTTEFALWEVKTLSLSNASPPADDQ